MALKQTCKLVPIDSAYESIDLPHQKVLVLGRCPLTKITDKRCSRSQVEVSADLDLKEVKLKHTGVNRVGVNGFTLDKKSSIILKHNDRIELVLGYFIYRIEFTPPPESLANEKKRHLEDGESSTEKKIRTLASAPQRDMPGTSSETKLHVTYNNEDSDERTEENKWETIDNGNLLIYTSGHIEGRSKIAGFDLDGTLIVTKSGKVFPVNNDDWQLAFQNIPSKLKSLWEDGYKVVIMTNQAGICRGKVDVNSFKNKIMAILKKFSIPLQVFVSTGKGIYRKPMPGMWNELVENKNNNVEVDMAKCFFCGDAAGRAANWAPKKKKDFSCVDRLLAVNLHINFFTPEEYFLKSKTAPYVLPEFNPRELDVNTPLCIPCDTNITSNECEVIVLVGSPGSGKSHFARTYLVPEGYVHVNRDTLGSWQKCVSTLDSALGKGNSAVVDNTSPDMESRRRLIGIAKKYGVSCRCFVLNTSLQHAKHNNRFRELTNEDHEPVNDIIINMYKKKYVEPTKEEGFSEIVKVNCIPKFQNEEHEKLYKMYLLEK